MFEILFRITDNIEDLMMLDENTFDMGGDISGFFAINVNGYHYGHYHNFPLQSGECGLESISNWFLVLIRAYQELNRSDYVAVSDIESFIVWIEFRKIQDIVEINIIRAEKPDGTTELRLTPFEDFEYGKWYIQLIKSGEFHDESVERRNESIKLSKLRSELLRKSLQYLDELREINPKLLGNKKIAELEALRASME